MQQDVRPLVIPADAKRALRIMYIAKHARGDGRPNEDGNHAIYHHEVRTVLEGLGLDLTLASRLEELFAKPDVDFVFPLLNRGGFLNSEMMAPLLCTYHGIPYLGANPFLRGMSDDKHASKMAAVARGVPTAPWAIYRNGAPVLEAECPRAERYVIKPNASSASWGLSDAHNWAGVEAAVAGIHAQGHDAIVEPFVAGSDVEVPVITVGGPVIMPMMLFEQADPTHLRTYYEKRDLVDRSQKYQLLDFDDAEWQPRIHELTQRLIPEFWPFDYGRFEFRLDRAAGEVRFLEVNLNCNLWSQKVFGRSALKAGLSQEQLIETILAASLARHGLI